MTRTRRTIVERRSPWATLVWRLCLLCFILIVLIMVLPWLMIAAAVTLVVLASMWAWRKWHRRGLARA